MTDPPFELYRRQMVGSLRGRVLEVGAGRGRNLTLLSAGVQWQGLEPHRGRYARLRHLASQHSQAVAPLLAKAEDIPLPDATVDGVLSMATLCSVGDPQLVLSEIRRVLRPGGRLAFAEHVAAPTGTWSRRVQRAVAPLSRRFDHGCDPLRDTEATLRGSGLEVRKLRGCPGSRRS